MHLCHIKKDHTVCELGWRKHKAHCKGILFIISFVKSIKWGDYYANWWFLFLTVKM